MSQQCPYYPTPRENPPHPTNYLAEHTEHYPLVKARLWNGQHVWLITRYENVRAVLMDSETFSQKPEPGYPTATEGRGSTVPTEVPTFVRMNPPEHTVKRRMVTADFTLKAANTLRPRMAELVDGLLDRIEQKGPPSDLFADFASPMPTAIITEYLGLPLEDLAFTQEKSWTKLNPETDGPTAKQAQLDLIAYLDKQLRLKDQDPHANDVMSRLLRDHVKPGHIGWEEALYTIELILAAGLETTANMLALGVLTLLQHPDQFEMLRVNRELMGSAVNELLRYLTVNQSIAVGARLCKKDTVIGGQPIRAGEGVFTVLQSANRDETVFPDPDRFDITRNPANHLAFGYGVHQCLGMALAKVEMEVALNKLLDRFPTLRLAVPFEELQFKHATVFGVKALPVAW
ncbi:cytochrome P450 [Ramlibacter sp. 2FC]|uniref:cytochrome P450 n=1 Tax=Ramlibacter sp. 2FC TaxID=2502188 RepID=UPI0010F936B4|nr:cytochrome P450 [Ramlibacter sp. 2FC]